MKRTLAFALTTLGVGGAASLVSFGIRLRDGSRSASGTTIPNGFHRIVPPPPASAQESARSRLDSRNLRLARHLSEAGDAPQALRLLDESARTLTPLQRAWSVVNNRIWSDALLRGGEYRTILTAYRSLGASPDQGVPPAVVVADVESDGRIDLAPGLDQIHFDRTDVARFVAKDMADDVPTGGTPKKLLTLAYLAIGQDYHAEANFQAPRWYFERAARLSPGDPYCAWSLGSVLNEEGQPAAALAALRRARVPRTAGLRRRLAEEIEIARGALHDDRTGRDRPANPVDDSNLSMPSNQDDWPTPNL